MFIKNSPKIKALTFFRFLFFKVNLYLLTKPEILLSKFKLKHFNPYQK